MDMLCHFLTGVGKFNYWKKYVEHSKRSDMGGRNSNYWSHSK